MFKTIQYSVKSYLQHIVRESASFRQYLTKLERLEDEGEAARRGFQIQALRSIATYAAQHVPYWRQTFRECGLDPDKIKSVEDLQVLPFLTKKDVQEQLHNFLSERAFRFFLVKGRTSGTTGSPGVFFRDTRSIVFENAMLWHLRSKARMHPGNRLALMRGDVVVPSSKQCPPFWIRNYGANALIVSSYHLKPEFKEEILNAFDSFAPESAFAYPSAAYVLASWCAGLNRPLPFVNLHTSSESVLAGHKELIQSSLRGHWLDHYGQAERVNCIASIDGDHYREYSEYGITELIPLDDGRMEIVGTSLHNYAMPLFRYRTGDIAHSRRTDGQNRPIIEGLEGRMEDFAILPDGSAIGRLDLVFKGLRHIELGQIYQPARDQIIIRVVTSPGFSNLDKKFLLANARERLGHQVSIDVDTVRDIPRTENGKFKFVVSDVQKNFLNS